MPYLGLRGTQLNIAVGFIASIGFLLFGYDQGVMGALLTLPSFVKQFPAINAVSYPGEDPAVLNHKSTLQGATVGLYEIGCMSGALSVLYVGDKLGRRWTIFCGGAIMIVGAVIQCSSFSLAQLIVGRLVTGGGNGLLTSTVPIWQSECSKPHMRGKLVMIEGAMITFGIMISYWVDFGFYAGSNASKGGDSSSVVWRFPIGLQIIFGIILCSFVLVLPESPRWLMKKGRRAEAERVLAALEGTGNTELVKSDLAEITASLREEGHSLRALITMGKDKHLHRTILAFVNQVFQQISGINLITYYAATILQSNIGLSPFVSRIVAAANGTEYFAASWIAVFTIEKFGRRKLMIFGAIGQSLSMVILAATTAYPKSKGAQIVAAIMLFVFNTFFAVGWLGMTWLYPAEIVGLQIRAPATGISTAGNWVFNFMVVMITPIAFSSIQYKTYIIFAVINAFIIPCVYIFYPETAGRSLEEMDDIFAESKSPFDVVRIANTMPKRHGKHGQLLMDNSKVDGYGRDESTTAGAQKEYGNGVENVA